MSVECGRATYEGSQSTTFWTRFNLSVAAQRWEHTRFGIWGAQCRMLLPVLQHGAFSFRAAFVTHAANTTCSNRCFVTCAAEQGRVSNPLFLFTSLCFQLPESTSSETLAFINRLGIFRRLSLASPLLRLGLACLCPSPESRCGRETWRAQPIAKCYVFRTR